MQLKEVLTNSIDKYHLVYISDIKIIIEDLDLEMITEDQFNNLLKFLESLSFYIDCFILDNQNMECLFYYKKKLPSLNRTTLIKYIINSGLVDISSILNSGIIKKYKLLEKKSIKNIEGLELVMVIPELEDYYCNILSEVCYRYTLRLAICHIFDYGFYSIKLVFKTLKMKDKKHKIELFNNYLYFSKKEKELLFCNPKNQNYSFTNELSGLYWRKIYNKLEKRLL